MPQRPDEKPSQEKLQFTRSQNFVRIYANSVQVETSTWDCRLIFGESSRIEGRNSVEQLVSVVMSPQHAKALVGVLANQLKEYEEKFGPLKLEPTEKPANATQPAKTVKAEKG